MKFTTPVSVLQQEPKMDHHSRIFLAGSCFVENIGNKFDYYKLPNKRNPLGILYHPFGIRDMFARATNENYFTTEDVFFFNERWHCFEAHSSMSDPDRDDLLKKLNEALKSTREYLLKTTHILITPGTSWIYRRVENDRPVANCHKLPQVNFRKEISSLTSLEDAFSDIIASIRKLNTTCQIIFTISPVRHIKDGMIENQVSKSLLFVAIQKFLSAQNFIFYFPSYEILMDELRDYRYYAEDMLHPGKTGIDYIWQKFSFSWLSPETTLMLKEIDNIQKGLLHRPFHENSEAHKKFRSALTAKIQAIQKKYPHISF